MVAPHPLSIITPPARRLVVVLICLAFGLLASAALAQQPNSPEPDPEADPHYIPDANAWAVKVYPFPSDFAWSEGDRENAKLVTPPAMPRADATPEEVVAFLRANHEVQSKYFESWKFPLPEGTLAALDPTSGTLAIRTTHATHEFIQAFTHHYVSRLPETLVFQVHLLEADGKTVRELIRDGMAVVDHGALLTRLEALKAQGRAREIRTLRLETRSGQRASVFSGTELQYAVAEGVDGAGQLIEVPHQRRVGTSVEIEATRWPDFRTMEVNCQMEHHHAPPEMRWEVTAQREGRAIESKIPEFRSTKLMMASSLRSGWTKILGIWKPEVAGEDAAADRLQIAFLKAEIVRLKPAMDHRVEKLLLAHGAAVLPVPADPKPAPVPAGMVTRVLHVQAELLMVEDLRPIGSGATQIKDPFAQASRDPEQRVTALVDYLQSQGIPFPTGSAVRCDALTETLVVRNFPANIEMVQQLFSELCCTKPRSLVAVLHVVQADAGLIRKLEAEAAPLSDHSAVWKTMEAEIAAGRGSFLRSAWLGTRSGQRNIFSSGAEYYAAPDMTELESIPAAGAQAADQSGKGETPGDMNPVVAENNSVPQRPPAPLRQAGLHMNLDTVLGPDGVTIDANYLLEYHYAPPSPRRDTTAPDPKALRIHPFGREFHSVRQATALTLLSGQTKLIGTWKPKGTPELDGAGDILQAAFLRVETVQGDW